MGKKEHLLYFDVLRIIAAYFVIFNHTGNNGYMYFLTCDTNTFGFYITLLLSVICKISVPLFFMISGALLLQKEDSVSKLMQRVLRISVALFVFSVLSYVQQIRFGNEVLNIKHFFVRLVESDWLNPFWYLYSYLAYLVTIPFIRAMRKGMQTKHYQYLFFLMIVFNGIVPILFFVTCNGNHHLNYNFAVGWVLSNTLFYPLFGDYLVNRFDENWITNKKMVVMWGCNIVAIVVTIVITTLDYIHTDAFSQNYIMRFVWLNCAAIIISLKKVFNKINVTERVARFLKEAGACTFGIYLFHGLFLREPKFGLWRMVSKQFDFPIIVNTLINCFEIMIVGGFITAILRRIPIIKKIF